MIKATPTGETKMTDRRTDFELRFLRSQAAAMLSSTTSPVKRRYWHDQFHRADEELRDREWERKLSASYIVDPEFDQDDAR
jgi:hypothetical protein